MKSVNRISSSDARHEWMNRVSEKRIEKEIRTKKFQAFVDMIYEDGLTIGTRGISPDGKDYCIPSLPGRGFSGYEMLAWYYVSWAMTAPEAVDSLNLPFSAAYRSAVQMYRAKKGKS